MPAIIRGGAIHSGRLYLASSQISNAVVRSRTRQELLDAVVRILVESGGFVMAFAAWHDPATRELKPVARFGEDSDYVDRIRLYTDDRPEGQGPSGFAFRSGTSYVCQDFLHDPRTALWREKAAAYDWHASAAIPISMRGAPHGVVSAYSRETGIFGPEEIALFEQVAIDVSIGLDRLDAEEARRLAEFALGASERRLKLALDAAGIGTFEWDLATRQVVWDEHSERLFGYEPGGFGGTYAGFADRVHPKDRPGVDQVLAAAIETGAPFTHEFRIVWPDGSVHWMSMRGEFGDGGNGQPLRMHGVLFDISERKRAETALRESEERLGEAIRVSGIGIFDHDHLANTLYWSPEQRQIHGFDEESTVSLDSFLARVHPDDRPRIVEEVRRAHDPSGEGRFDVEHRLLLPDGSIRWTRTRSQTFFEGERPCRHPVRTVGAVTDITERKRVEDELKKLASVVEMSTEFISIETLDGNVIYLNNAAMNQVGIRSMEEARSKTIFDFAEGEIREQIAGQVHPAVLKEGVWSGELRLRHFQTGEPIDVDLTGFLIRNERGIPIYIATVSRDVTERKRAAAEKAKLEASLNQAQRMESIGRLAGGVAHDFNNMLTVILGFATLAQATDLDPDVLRGHLDEIVKAADRSRQMTQQLLGFSRQQIIAPKPANLNSILEDLRKPLARLIGEDIELRFHPEENLWKAMLDPCQVNQILLNLAVNARDAMPNGGKLTIETANSRVSSDYARTVANCAPGNYVMLAVSDNGTGMNREIQAHIFEPFFTTKEKGKGTGLGLATVYGIVQQNAGFITVYSEVGRGTTFRIYFPMLAGEGESAKTATAPAPSGKGNVLVVEDDELVRGVTTSALMSLGYTPLVASSAQEALRICGQPGADIRLILTDVVMAGMTGVELRDHVNEVCPEIKVLFMSGYTSNVIVNHGVLKEGIHFIQKPFTLEELGRKVAKILGSDG